MESISWIGQNGHTDANAHDAGLFESMSGYQMHEVTVDGVFIVKDDDKKSVSRRISLFVENDVTSIDVPSGDHDKRRGRKLMFWRGLNDRLILSSIKQKRK